MIKGIKRIDNKNIINCGDCTNVFVHYSSIEIDGYKTITDNDLNQYKLQVNN